MTDRESSHSANTPTAHCYVVYPVLPMDILSLYVLLPA